MTELEKIAYAKSFIDKLANGINPLNDTPIPEGDIANNVRISRCFFFVSDVLRQVVENGGIEKPKKHGKIPFSITQEQLLGFNYSETPISISEIVGRINSLVNLELMKKLSYKQVSRWLIANQILQIETIQGTAKKVPTEAGQSLGITVELRRGYRGEYLATLYNKEAQSFILDNIEAIIAFNQKD